ncbi:MAG: FtsQ-type POTRA domain-containing protein [Cyanobacteria bacterium P01_H01_bin.130]
MTQIRPISRERLVERRSQLKRRRQTRVLWGGWQSLAAIALLGGTGWLITAPIWVVRSPAQIDVEGNTHLEADQIRQLLGLTYPQSLWRLEPEAIAASLKARAPLNEVTVTRRLLPPGLTVQVQELQPVAVVQLSPGTETASPSPGTLEPDTPQPGTVGLIDRNGEWIDIARYQQAGEGERSLPPLKLVASQAQIAQQWPDLYRQIKLSPVRISAIQWQDANNLILETEIGTVHLGPLGPQLGDQLTRLAQLRSLPDQLSASNTPNYYVDLRDPNTPILQTQQPPRPTPSPSP